MQIDKTFTVCFSGYRPEKFDFPFENGSLKHMELELRIKKAIIKALDLGYRWFMCGMANGFDLLCADILLDIREHCKQYSGIRLIAVQPYTQFNKSDLHQTVSTCADQVVIISPEYHQNCFYQRNKYMVDNSVYLICYYDGKEGGTAQTVRMAEKENLFIDNISQFK